MQVNIINFGRIAEIAGGSNLTVNNIPDTDALKSFLEDTYPALRNTKYVLAVNKQLVNEKTILTHNTTVAILPPFSGG